MKVNKKSLEIARATFIQAQWLSQCKTSSAKAKALKNEATTNMEDSWLIIHVTTYYFMQITSQGDREKDMAYTNLLNRKWHLKK